MAVTDASQVFNPVATGDNILTSLLLTSELRGRIENPAYYFMNDNPGAENALDYLMLTHGWRRFLWKEILNDKWPVINHEPEKDVLVRKGQVLYMANDIQKGLTRVSYWMLRAKTPHNIFADENGVFHYYMNATYESESVFFDVTDTKGQRNEFKIMFGKDLPAYPQAGSNEILTISAESRNCLKKRIEKFSLEAAFNYSADKNPLLSEDLKKEDPDNQPNRFFDAPDQSIRLDKYTSFSNMVEVFREIVPLVSLTYKKGVNKIRVYSNEYIKNFTRQPLFMIDGFPTYNKTYVLNLDPDMVETIEVINSMHKLRKLGFKHNIVIGPTKQEFYEFINKKGMTINLNKKRRRAKIIT